MARTKTKILDLNSALLQQGKTAAGTQPLAPVLAETPVSEMPLVLTLDEVNPNPDNPRTSRNPRYEEIKSSILARGLDTVPKVTRDPERPELGYFSVMEAIRVMPFFPSSGRKREKNGFIASLVYSSPARTIILRDWSSCRE